MPGKIINEILVTANRAPESDECDVWLLCFLGQPGKPETGPHFLWRAHYCDAREIVVEYIGTIPARVDARRYITGDYIVLDRYILAETDEARHGCVGCWEDRDGKMWSIYHERGNDAN